jgi:hypothetical protein
MQPLGLAPAGRVAENAQREEHGESPEKRAKHDPRQRTGDDPRRLRDGDEAQKRDGRRDQAGEPEPSGEGTLRPAPGHMAVWKPRSEPKLEERKPRETGKAENGGKLAHPSTRIAAFCGS